MAFEGSTSEGLSVVMDATEEHGGRALGPSPLETLLSSLGACSGIDVVSILHKKRMTVTKYRIEIEAERQEGEFPHPFTCIVLRHLVEGPDLTQEAVEQAVKLSDEKYCSAIATLRFSPEVKSEAQVVAYGDPQ